MPGAVTSCPFPRPLQAPVPPNFAAPNDRAATSSSDRVYTNYYVYKTRAAMCLRLLPPTFAKAQAGKVSSFLQSATRRLVPWQRVGIARPGTAQQQECHGEIAG